MSSEAAYFPGALANAPEAESAAASELEMPAGTQSKVSAVLVRTAETADDHLMEQVRDGSKDALALLFRRHARSVRNVAYRILRDEAEADGNTLLPADDNLREKCCSLKSLRATEPSGKIDCSIPVERVRFHEPRPVAVQKLFDTAHAVQPVSEEFEDASGRDREPLPQGKQLTRRWHVAELPHIHQQTLAQFEIAERRARNYVRRRSAK